MTKLPDLPVCVHCTPRLQAQVILTALDPPSIRGTLKVKWGGGESSLLRKCPHLQDARPPGLARHSDSPRNLPRFARDHRTADLNPVLSGRHLTSSRKTAGWNGGAHPSPPTPGLRVCALQASSDDDILVSTKITNAGIYPLTQQFRSKRIFSGMFIRTRCMRAEFKAELWRPFRAWLETLWSASNRASGRCGKAWALLDRSSLEAHLAGLWSMKVKLGSKPSLGVNSNFSTNQLWDPHLLVNFLLPLALGLSFGGVYLVRPRPQFCSPSLT